MHCNFQVSFHPEKDLTLLDVTNDAILVVHGSLRDSPSLRFGSLHGDDSGTVTEWTTFATPTTTATTTRGRLVTNVSLKIN
jgi:hypothetical protein